MNIQCESCQARYNLDERLFRDSRAVRVKCRKCGGFIVVARPEAPEASPVVTPAVVAPLPVVAQEAVVTPPAGPVPVAPPAAELRVPPMPPSGEESEEPDMVVIMAMPDPPAVNPAASTVPPVSPRIAEAVAPPQSERKPLRTVPPRSKEEWVARTLPTAWPAPPPSSSVRTPVSPVSPPAAAAGEAEARTKSSAAGPSFLGNLVLLPSETNVSPFPAEEKQPPQAPYAPSPGPRPGPPLAPPPKPPPAPPLDPVRAARMSPAYTVSRGVRLDPEKLVENRCVAFFPDAPELEPYRVLRTRILQAAEKKGGNTVMITSALPREGKTVTAINLALTFSKTYQQTALLVDCDLRQQRVHEVLGFAGGVGLGDYLTEGCPVSDMMVWPGVEKLTLISGGKTVSESSELLGSPAMRGLVEDMKGRYPNRYVFFDVPPVLAGADTITFAPLVDHILFVVQAGRSSLEDVRKALQMLPKEKILGLVLNRQPDAGARKHCYY
jgi:protein-tyrosine kinase